jgi:muramoyltetrapeptide carboxypeptidase
VALLAKTAVLAIRILERTQGVAVRQSFLADAPQRGKWPFIDVLRDQLSRLGIPVLGGLPIGHGPHPRSIPLAAMAKLDVRDRTFVVELGVL